ncbi:transcriptional activator, TenA family [Chloroherpeton thalassium ATCC 35110]|uniref:Transcriptional activator, TenA family n=1 Tax=Chloroherpeton thalassium (strain ATCC 35110 / GB-78) TaxID=517418 RepID=B3QVS9_CHLT3|nr:TenA family transcriptional regulator [Chloroherpeton thalassium]ACF13136.1 transcriptional activator, TenA family [Chloroherpeton thalassium ATCC 35110]
MKNPRRLVLTAEFIAKHGLSTAPPPENSLFWKMWNACESIAQASLNTDFIQGIKNGTLDPVKYGAFNVSDAYYCFNGAQDYLAAESRASDPTLRAFLYEKYNSYQTYNEEFPDTWHIRDARGVIPLEICEEYSGFEKTVASHENPIYTLVAMIPCEYLWYWLAHELYPPASGNLYAPWIDGNNYPDGAYAMGNFLNDYQIAHPDEIDENTAIEIYTQAMTYEQRNFSAATASQS